MNPDGWKLLRDASTYRLKAASLKLLNTDFIRDHTYFEPCDQHSFLSIMFLELGDPEKAQGKVTASPP